VLTFPCELLPPSNFFLFVWFDPDRLCTEEDAAILFWAPPAVATGGEEEKIDTLLNFIFGLTLAALLSLRCVLFGLPDSLPSAPGAQGALQPRKQHDGVLVDDHSDGHLFDAGCHGATVCGSISRSPHTPGWCRHRGYRRLPIRLGHALRGADGQLGTADVKRISLENKFGLDRRAILLREDEFHFDRAGDSGGPARCTSCCVHAMSYTSFYVPRFRLYQDARARADDRMDLRSRQTRTGEFELACSQASRDGALQHESQNPHRLTGGL